MKKIILIALLILSGCTGKYADISNHKGYAHLINTTYATKLDMYISGVNLPPGYGKDINVYIISPINPTWTGPEVISRDILKHGSKLTIQSMKKCTNCLEEKSSVRAVVTISHYEKQVNVPIEISLEYINPRYFDKI